MTDPFSTYNVNGEGIQRKHLFVLMKKAFWVKIYNL